MWDDDNGEQLKLLIEELTSTLKKTNQAIAENTAELKLLNAIITPPVPSTAVKLVAIFGQPQTKN